MARCCTAKPPDARTRQACLRLLHDAALRHQVPPALIISHSNQRDASRARKEVQKAMIEDLGMKRRWVAWVFNRDIRRVRASELGQKPDRRYCRKTGKFRVFREILIPVGPQLWWRDCVEIEGQSTGQRMRFTVTRRDSRGTVQLVLEFVSWRRPLELSQSGSHLGRCQ